ncbi:unnamed protein product [Sphenostylis stenocarpa]|uniref:Uncharacterized protein n=1 Tax=Sphenostylis stenocarpa TaxID=92480 RepID=A0AA86VQA4_9FABA|nr:unnamed protein product [Sphenostylis stenocarpa]
MAFVPGSCPRDPLTSSLMTRIMGEMFKDFERRREREVERKRDHTRKRQEV